MDQADHFATRVVEMNEIKVNNPVVICGFLGSTPAGTLTASYLIENLKMHEVAHVRSSHLAPVAVFVGGKLRTPFRVYTHSSGKIMIITSEIPIDMEGLYEISDTLINWLEKLKISELVILEGIPVEQTPQKRTTYGVADPEALSILKNKGIEIANSALVTGMGGALINECLTRKIKAMSLLTPMFVGYPDPETVLSLVNALNGLYDLNVTVSDLRSQVERIHGEVNKVVNNYNAMKKKEVMDSDILYQ